jgi:hypothetical protein
MKVQKKAAKCLKEFEVMAVHPNGRKRNIMQDNVSEFTRELVYKAHAEMLPDDYKYSFVIEALELIADFNGEEYLDIITEIEADIYTSGLTEWLNSNNSRVYYLTEALEEMDIKDGFQLLSYAQIKEKIEVFYIVIDYLENNKF